jgi:GcrA cell cycle regulator
MTDIMDVVDKRVSWTDERIDLLKTLWSEGLSAAEIAVALGHVTRNAVCGKIDRLGLSAFKPRLLAAPRVHPVREKIYNPQRAQRILEKVAAPVPEFVCDPVELESLHLTIEQLDEHHCRWPELDGPEQTYCGLQVKKDRPYCPGHCLQAYQPLVAKARPIRDAELKQGRGGIFGQGRSA